MAYHLDFSKQAQKDILKNYLCYLMNLPNILLLVRANPNN